MEQHTDRDRRDARRSWTARLLVAAGAVGLAAATCVGVGAAPAGAASSVAMLYGAPNYQGGQRELYPGSMVDFSGTTWDDAASSIRVTPGTKVVVYRDPELTGICEVITADDPNLANNVVGDNQITTIHVGAACYAPVAKIYADLSFTGGFRVIELLGGWENRDLRRSDFNDTTTSIKVLPGQTFAAYSDPNYKGRCETFTASDGDLRNNRVGDDAISSIRVGTCGVPIA